MSPQRPPPGHPRTSGPIWKRPCACCSATTSISTNSTWPVSATVPATVPACTRPCSRQRRRARSAISASRRIRSALQRISSPPVSMKRCNIPSAISLRRARPVSYTHLGARARADERRDRRRSAPSARGGPPRGRAGKPAARPRSKIKSRQGGTDMKQITLGATGITVPQNAFGALPILSLIHILSSSSTVLHLRIARFACSRNHEL